MRRALLGLLAGVAVVAILEGVARVVEPPPGPVTILVPTVAGATTLALTPRTVGRDPWLPTTGGCFETDPELTVPPGIVQAARFCLPKQPRAVRVFVVGGSETFGIPFADQPTRVYPGRLAAHLAEWLPYRPVEVINAGLVGQESSMMARVAERVAAAYEPDVIVFTGGGNDARWYYERAGELNPQLWDARRSTARLASFRLLERWVSPPVPETPPADLTDRRKAEQRRLAQRRWDNAGAPLIEDVAAARPRRTDPDLRAIDAAYLDATRAIVAAGRRAGALVVIAPPPMNRHVPPDAPLHDPRLSSGDRARYDALVARASAEPASALATWTEAVGLDPACATGWYGLGEAKAAAGDHAGAWAAFDKAAWLDHGTFRLLPQVAADARAVCDDGSCVAVDLDAFLERVAGPDEYGRGFFASPSHFSLEGDERIGTAVARAIADHFAAEERRTLPR